MKKYFLLAGIFLIFQYKTNAFEYVSDGGLFVIEFEKDWSKTKSNDPTVVLRLEKGKSLIEVSKLEDELSDFYLKARLKEQIEDLKNKGISDISGIKTASVHSITNAYYISYIKDSQINVISFLTYAGNSYAVISKGIDETAFKDLIYFFRKPDEKIEIKKPKPQPKKVRIAKKESEEEFPLISFSTGLEARLTQQEEVSFSSFQVSTTPAILTNIQKEVQIKQAEAQKLVEKIIQKASLSNKSYIERKPLNKFLVVAILIVWFALSKFFGFIASKIPNPKITPYPQDVPPDFFFPFIITRVNTLRETMYQIITRQKQVLSAYYNHQHKFLCNFGIYGIIFFHIFWSLSQFFNKDFLANFILSLPFGRYISSFPEGLFFIVFLFGILKKAGNKQRLRIFDSQMNLIMEVSKDKNFYAVLRDGKGKEVAYLHNKGTILRRKWYFTDLDNHIAFSIIDEHPYIYLLSKLFGSAGGKLRNRYGMFVEGKRIGFLFVDPNSKEGFQIHLEYSYARIAHPAQIMASMLYIISKEKERLLFTV